MAVQSPTPKKELYTSCFYKSITLCSKFTLSSTCAIAEDMAAVIQPDVNITVHWQAPFNDKSVDTSNILL